MKKDGEVRKIREEMEIKDQECRKWQELLEKTRQDLK